MSQPEPTPGDSAPASAEEAEVARQLQICNACRYCEGYCAVFPAMTRRLAFSRQDIHYLANLCHQCGACLHACQYAPPHEFAVNVPQAMTRVRRQTTERFAWPGALGRLFQRQGLAMALALSAALALFLALAAAGQGSLWRAVPEGRFYAIFPHGLMVAMFGPVFALALLVLCVSVARFWRQVSPDDAALSSGAALREAGHHALSLRYLDGGHGQGCPNEDDRATLARRRFHHATSGGFGLCLAATGVATVYHYALGWIAPYGWTSLPKLLGTAGGIGLLVGTTGLAWLHTRRHGLHGDAEQRSVDLGFLALLFLISASGLLLALLKTTPALPLLLCLHLGAVMALFLTLPYGKMTHAIYRGAALLKWSIERRQPTKLRLGSE
ncbi:MAG: tricarballylate utilization 4Fe-4S protein TcuB [Rubrivivax sp.]|nr:tricarballylate utilization 4Fe-4S protein TcuB [Rubrivivax sp.]